MDRGTLIKLTVSQVMSHLNFCCMLYYGLPEYLLDKLQHVQNCAARLITGVNKREHISPVIKELNWLNVRNFIKFRYAVNVYKCINGDMPPYLTNLLSFHLVQTHNLRSNEDFLLSVPKMNKKIGDRAFSHAGPVIWNMLPKDVKLSPNIVIFKRKLKTHFLTRQ